MTDKIIPKKTAIDRMRDGLPCETQCDKAWDRTFWRDFDDPRATFRIPPEPRREAREWSAVTGLCFDFRDPCNLVKPIHVREVLPDEVCVRRMTESDICMKLLRAPAELMHRSDIAGAIRLARALGLLKEGKS